MLPLSLLFQYRKCKRRSQQQLSLPYLQINNIYTIELLAYSLEGDYESVKKSELLNCPLF
jgi:hypothetical protein